MERVAIPETTRTYYFKLKCLTFYGGTKHCFINEYHHEMKHECIKKDSYLWASVEDIIQIYSPELDITEEANDFRFEYKDRTLHIAKAPETISSGELSLDDRAVNVNGVWYLPFVWIMKTFFNKYIQSFKEAALSDFLLINDDEELPSKWEGKRMQLVVYGKNRGTVCGMIWFEKGKRLLPFRAYIPTSYREGQPMPLVILTHGGSSPQSVEFARAGHKFENIAEKRGYMLFGIDGYIESSFYGSIYPTSSTIGELDKTKVDMKNPKGYSEAVLALRKEGEEACEEQILYAFKLLEVDKKRVYMMGNSMGGAGTYYLASINPGMFRAIAPCGGSVNPDFFPLDTLKGMPICLFAGSEDENGLEPLKEAARMMKERGLDHSFYVIGGAKHPDGYVEALDEIFDFFDSNS